MNEINEFTTSELRLFHVPTVCLINYIWYLRKKIIFLKAGSLPSLEQPALYTLRSSTYTYWVRCSASNTICNLYIQYQRILNGLIKTPKYLHEHVLVFTWKGLLRYSGLGLNSASVQLLDGTWVKEKTEIPLRLPSCQSFKSC